MSQLFTDQLLTNFQTDLNAAAGGAVALQGLHLMNGDAAKRALPKSRQGTHTQLVQQCMMACKACIGDRYLKSALSRAFDAKKPNFDIALLVKYDPSKPVIRIEDQPLQNFDVVSFLVVEIGECEKMPNTASINLICARDFENFKNVGRNMMALFCYLILSNPALDQRGVLEVANGFENPGAFCMYQKFGFQPEYSLYTDITASCFDEAKLVPMIIDFENGPDFAGLSVEQKKQKILEVAARNANIGKKDRLCDVRDGQSLFAFLSQLHIMELRDNRAENQEHEELAALLTKETGLPRDYFPRFKQFILQKRMAENPSWLDYVAKLSNWMTEQLKEFGITCSAGGVVAIPSPGKIPEDLKQAIAATLAPAENLHVPLSPKSPNATRASSPAPMVVDEEEKEVIQTPVPQLTMPQMVRPVATRQAKPVAPRMTTRTTRSFRPYGGGGKKKNTRRKRRG